MLKQFLELSRVLTGVDELDEAQGARHLERLLGDPTGARLHEAIVVYERIRSEGGDVDGKIRRRILSDPGLGAAARQIVFLWYAGTFLDEQGKPRAAWDPSAYFSGLVWSIVGAHVPGLSGGYFGHWRYAPDS